jgi:SAM-dependent methyltransferase
VRPVQGTAPNGSEGSRRFAGVSQRVRIKAALVFARFVVCATALLGGAPASTAQALSTVPVYETTAASPDGIGKRYMGREIAHVMGWQGAAWLEREEREREERTDLLVKELALQPGMVVADIGAGTGYIARRMAALLGPGGVVFAVDVQPEMIEMLRTLALKAKLPQIRPVLGTAQDVKLAPASIDLAIMVDVYHELEYPREVLASLVRALKPGGRVVFVEYRAEDAGVPIKPLHKMSEAQVKREAGALGLVWERTAAALPWQHIVVFKKPGAGAPVRSPV